MYDIGGEGLQPHASGSETGQGREYAHDHHRQERTTAQHETAVLVAEEPRGERRSVEVIGCAANAAEVATGKVEDTRYVQPNRVRAVQAGAFARASSTTLDERGAISRAAAAARWGDAK